MTGTPYSLAPVRRGEGRGEGRATFHFSPRSIRNLARANRSTDVRLHAHLAPLPCPLPAVPGRGSKGLARRRFWSLARHDSPDGPDVFADHFAAGVAEVFAGGFDHVLKALGDVGVIG